MKMLHLVEVQKTLKVLERQLNIVIIIKQYITGDGTWFNVCDTKTAQQASEYCAKKLCKAENSSRVGQKSKPC